MTSLLAEIPPSVARFEAGAPGLLARLVGNLPGFVYRCRPDAARTMEFMSERCRDVLGYDPHRFLGNQSLTYGRLIHPEDRARVDEEIFRAARSGRRFTCSYRVAAAFGRTVPVIDRGVGVLDADGVLHAIEGYVCAARDAESSGPEPLLVDHGRNDSGGEDRRNFVDTIGSAADASDDITAELRRQRAK